MQIFSLLFCFLSLMKFAKKKREFFSQPFLSIKEEVVQLQENKTTDLLSAGNLSSLLIKVSTNSNKNFTL